MATFDLLSFAWLALASAAGLLALGLFLLATPRRSGAALVLGLFAVFWALQIVSVRLSFVLGLDGPGWPLLLASQAFAVPLYLMLAHFAASFPTRLRVADRWWWPAALALPAVLTLGSFVLDPTSKVQARSGALWGWATLLLLVLPLLGSMLLALGRFVLAHEGARGEQERGRSRIAALALLAWLGHYIPATLLNAGGALPRLGPVGSVLYLLGLGAAGLLWLGLLVRFAWRAEGSARRWSLALSGAAVTSAVLAWSVGGDVVGLWRLLFVTMLAYAVTRYAMFDLDLRLRRAVTPIGAGLAGIAAGGVAVSLLDPAGLTGAGLAPGLLVGIVAGAVAWRPLGRAADAAFPAVRATREYHARRKVEVFRAAVDGGATGEALDQLALRVGLRAEERRALERSGLGTTKERGRYRIEGSLAQGSQGPLLLAWDGRVRERVVLKVYEGYAALAFVREAGALGSLEHRNVLAVRDVFRDGADLVLALEHAEQGSLQALLDARGALPAGEALRIAEEVLAGLAAAHVLGLVHRDVKPSNVLFRRGTAKLADFGVCADPLFEQALRASRAQPGTLAWMSPEQARDEPVTAASDVYAVGVLIHRMVAGEHYVATRGRSEREVRNAVIRRSLPPLRIPPLDDIVARATSKDPRQRYPDARAMLRDVRRARRAVKGRAALAASIATPVAVELPDRTLDGDALAG